MTKIYRCIGDLIRKSGKSTSQVLRDIGLTHNAMIHWKRGIVPNVESLVKVANYFNVSLDSLVGRTEPPVIVNCEQCKRYESVMSNIADLARGE